MPELYSRMDSANWLTPSISDILDQGANPPSGAIREYTLVLQRELTELETPARIVNVRSTPSYHLFVARPEMVGRMGNRRLVKPEEIEKSIEKIAEAHPEWTLGFVPTLRGEDQAVGILLRTRDHRPQSLRRLLVRDTFRKHPTTTALPCGITLEQHAILRDITEIGHLLIIGKDSARSHLLQGILLTLTLLNTPSELRIAIAGQTARTHRSFSEMPHALGKLLPDTEGGMRLLAGLIKEVQRRQTSFQEENARSFAHYNEIQIEKSRPILPRIVMLIDSLSDETWQTASATWLPLILKLGAEGHKAGIHLLMTTDEPLARSPLDTHIYTRVVMRSAGKDLVKDAGIHRSQSRFVDAFVWETRKESRVTPIEICAITALEVKRAVEYWRSNDRQRKSEATTTISSVPVSGKTGVTGLLQTQEAALVLSKPPTPEKPQPRALERATQVLQAQQPQPQHAERKPEQPALRVALAEAVQLEAHTVEAPAASEPPWTAETPVVADVPTPEKKAVELPLPQPDSPPSIEPLLPGVLYPTNGNLTNFTLETVESVGTKRLGQSQALAAYLGWLSAGALQDILMLSREEALLILEELKQKQVLEQTSAPAPRFLPLLKGKETP